MPALASVAIESKGATEDLKARFGLAPGERVAWKTAAAGAGAGAAAGVGWALACGPYFLVCAMMTVPTTTLLGGAAGGLAGSASDHHKTPPDEQLLALDKQFVQIYNERTLHMEIRDALEKQIPPGRLADPDMAEGLVELKLSDIQFTRTISNRYRWTLESIMVVTWNRNRGQTRHSYEIYEYTSDALPLDEWLKDDGEMLNRALGLGADYLAGQMAEDIGYCDP